MIEPGLVYGQKEQQANGDPVKVSSFVKRSQIQIFVCSLLMFSLIGSSQNTAFQRYLGPLLSSPLLKCLTIFTTCLLFQNIR